MKRTPSKVDKKLPEQSIRAFRMIQKWTRGNPIPEIPDLSGPMCPIPAAKKIWIPIGEESHKGQGSGPLRKERSGSRKKMPRKGGKVDY